MHTDQLKQQYESRSKDFEQKAQTLKSRYLSWSLIRLVLFIVAIGVVIYLATAPLWWLAIVFGVFFIIGFGYFVRWHLQMQAQQRHFEHLTKVNQLERNCMDHDFAAFEDGKEFIDPLHAFAVDLDLFGPFSFFQYINRTATSIGKKCLARYLTTQLVPIAEIEARQAAIQELNEQLDWRQHFQAHGMSAEDDPSHIKALEIWLDEPPFVNNNKRWKFALYFTPIWMILGCVLWYLYIPWQAFILFLIVPGYVLRQTLEQVNKTHLQTTHAGNILSFYARLIKHIEQTDFQAKKLQELKNTFLQNNTTASKDIRRLSYIISQLNVRYNAFAIVLNIFALWDLHWVSSLEKWKSTRRKSLLEWFTALQEFEALASLANVHHNNPSWIFPKVSKKQLLAGKEVGHPLINPDQRICNDFTIPTQAHLKLITGSNMAGKSTFLRTVGLNVILAMSGSAVCAREFNLPLLKVYTSMRTQDALHESTSSFFAELKRLKFIIEAVESNQPEDGAVFFLLDEILKGTNSRDRHTGSKALIKQFIKSKGAGIIATHDLELGALEALSEGAIENWRIEVEVKEGELIFDYKLKKGVSESFNATQLMKNMGIRIEE